MSRPVHVLSLQLFLWACFTALVGCGKSAPASRPAPAPVAEEATSNAPENDSADQERQEQGQDEKAQCADLPGHRRESIVLPPEFAPELPDGIEELWFSPGMFDPKSEEFYSYCFSLRFRDPVVTSVESLQELLQAYYDGLMRAVAKDGGKEHPQDSAVEVAPLVAMVSTDGALMGLFLATIDTVDRFATDEAIRLHVRIGVEDGRCVLASVRRQPWGSPKELAAEWLSDNPPNWFPCLSCQGREP